LSTEHRAPFQAGDWIVEPELNCLRKDHQEKHLEPKVMKVLLALAEHPNHVVTKEDLIAAVWPGTFVSDDVLTRCISVLRRMTQDDATMPRFIQTVPKVGYRLLAPIHELPADPVEEQVEASPVPHMEVPTITSPEPLVQKQDRHIMLHPAVLAGVAIAVLAVLAFAVWRFLWTAPRETVLKTLPFTSRDGEQLQPAFSPDGKTVAYVAVPENGGPQHIYIKSITAETSAPITSGPGDDFSPTWSPDGTHIAYLSNSTEGMGIYLVDVRTRASRKVFVPQSASQWEQGALTWSPDGESLAFPDHAGSNPSSSIVLLNLKTLQSQTLTTPPDGWEGDLTPAFSPDGKRIAFSRASETAVRDLYWIAATGGPVHQITHDSAGIDSLAWFPDGKSIVFSSNRGGKSALWRVFLRGGTPARMPIGTEDAAQPTVSRSGNILRVAYTQGSAIWSIISITRGAEGISREVLSSTQEDSAPSFARDGLRFAFQSQRSGFQEIWMAAGDGTGAHPLTHGNGPLTGSPSWGHQHDEVLFDSRIGGHSHIFAIHATGGSPRQLTNGDFNDITPRWSTDDNTVYFRSNRGGRWQLWRVDRNGGSPQPVTTGDGIVPQESPDGKFLYFARGGEAGIWRVPIQGGPETQVLPEPAAGYWGYWEVTPHGIVFLDTKQTSLRTYDPATRSTTNFAKLKRLPPRFAGLSMNPNGQQILLTDESHASRHLTLSEMTAGL